jgi:autotransporter-associated beta strand protein
LTKLGSGTLTLTGTNTYAGATLVNNGELWLPNIQAGGGAIAVADGAALGVSLAAPGTSLVTTALTLGSSAGATNEYNLGAFGDPTTPVVNAANLVVNGTVYVNVTGLNLTPGQFSLIKYGSASGLTGTSFVLNYIPVAAYLSNNLANSSIDLVLTTEPNLLWSGSINGSWDIATTTNWSNAGTLQTTTYSDGAYVRFDDSASSTSVNVVTPVLPGGIWVSNNAHTYALGGAGISGLGGFTKDGAGTVIVSTPNSYTSNTVINAGTFQLGASQVIPSSGSSGSVTVNGKLDLAGNTQTINNLNGSGIIDNSSGNSTLNLGANNSPAFFSGVITNSGGTLAVTIPGTNTVTLTGNNGYSGGTTVSGGTVQIGGTNSLGSGLVSLVVPSAGITLASFGGGSALTNSISATGSADNPANFDSTAGDIVLNGTVTASGPDTVKLGTNNLWINAAGPSVENNRLLLYGGSIVFNGSGWLNVGAVRTFAPSGASVHLVITNGATVSFGQTGTGNVNLRLGYTSGLAGTNELDISSGQLLLNETFGQIYAGDTSGTYGAVNQTGGTILFEYPGATTGILLGSSAGSTGWYNLNGGYLITPQIIGGSGSGYFYFNGGTLTPSTSASATNFFSGVTAAYVANANAIFDTTNIDIVVSQSLLNGGNGGLVKLGSSALTLAGTNSYAGPTLVSNGTLNVTGSLGTNIVVVSASALAGTGVINGSVTINTNGTLFLGGYDSSVTGTLTINNNLVLAGNLSAKIDKSETQSNDTAIITGRLLNVGTGTLTLNNIGPALAAGDFFQLFNQPVVNGNKLVIASLPGAGLVWQNNLAVNGTVSVVTPQPVITQFNFSGTTLTIQGSSGQADSQFVLYASTNLTQPLSNWTPVATNTFDDNGNFNLTTSFNSTKPQEFFILRQ